jgi:hypothetical protein
VTLELAFEAYVFPMLDSRARESALRAAFVGHLGLGGGMRFSSSVRTFEVTIEPQTTAHAPRDE